MKITNEQLLALQQNEPLRKESNVAEGFESLLADKLGSAQTQGITSQAGIASGIVTGNMLTATQDLSREAALARTDIAAMQMQNVAMSIDSAFSAMEKYADEIGSSEEDSLKKAYGLLEGMSNQVSGLRSAYPNMEKTHPELATMVNELDVMTTTEMFKFNRGDYL